MTVVKEKEKETQQKTVRSEPIKTRIKYTHSVMHAGECANVTLGTAPDWLKKSARLLSLVGISCWKFFKPIKAGTTHSSRGSTFDSKLKTALVYRF